jgi:hypothetical protein
MKTPHLILIIITTISIVLVTDGCNQKKIEKNKNIFINEVHSNIVDGKETFDKFYQKFYSDSAFQISRVVFPLRIYNTNYIDGFEDVKNQENDTFFIKNNEMFLKKSGWIFIDSLTAVSNFEKTFEKQNFLIIESLNSKNEDIFYSREYQYIDGKWKLVSYYFASY